MKGYYIEITNNLLDPKHRKLIGESVWLFMWLIDKMTSITEEGIGRVLGGKPIKYEEIEKELGISRRTYINWVSILKEGKYINTLRTPNGLVITINKAKKRFGRDVQKNTHHIKESDVQNLESDEQKNVSDEQNRDIQYKTITKTINKDNTNKALSQQLVNYFFELKGWANKDKDFYKKKEIIYSRFTKPAKELLYLCDQNLEEAKNCLKKVAEWAKSRDLDWGVETVFKKWYELDLLKPKERKLYYRGNRVFQMGGRDYVLMPNGEKLEFVGNKEELIWK